jgi:thiol-disulfide isomerase/thioredoxin
MATPSAPQPQLVTLEEYQEVVENAERPVLLQFGSEFCSRCPDFHHAIAKLAPDYEFDWYYADAADAGDLAEAFQVRQLPAFVLVHPKEAGKASQNATVEHLRATVQAQCAMQRRFATDEEF